MTDRSKFRCLAGSVCTILFATLSVAQEVNWHGQAERLLYEEKYDEAQSWCARWLNVLEGQHGNGAVETADALICVGDAALGRKDYNKAQVALSSAVKLVEEKAGVFDLRLSHALYGLATLYRANGNIEDSENALLRAKNITHRNLGIFNLEQTDIVKSLSSLYYAQGNLSDATREQRFLLQANEEFYGETPQLLGAIRRMARWYKQIGNTLAERALYRRAIGISEAFFGPNDVRLIGPLRDFANSYIDTPRVNRVVSGDGTRALSRVIEILQAQEYVDQSDVVEAWTDLGEWYTLSGRSRSARSAYAAAWNRARQGGTVNDANGDPMAGQVVDLTSQFDRPVEIEYEPWPIGVRQSDVRRLPAGELVVEFEFTVTETGRVKRLRIVKDDIGIRDITNRLGRNVMHSRYRPRLVNGVPVATSNVRKVVKTQFKTVIDVSNASSDEDAVVPLVPEELAKDQSDNTGDSPSEEPIDEHVPEASSEPNE